MPKTATHAIRDALRAHIGPDDWEQQVLFGKQSLPIPEIARIGHGHISARAIKPVLERDVWAGYFKFGFVRNPFDRYISTCFFLNRQNAGFADNPHAFLSNALNVPRFRQRVLVRPQNEQLIGDDGRIALDYVGRYETLQQSYDDICERIGIPSTDLTRKNPSDHKPYTDYYDESLRRSVEQFYASDLRLFDYGFEPSDPTK